MAGPCADVFLPIAADHSLLSQIEAWVEAVSDGRKERDFWVTDSSSIGGSYRGEGRPFFFQLEEVDQAPADEWCDPNAEELAQVETEFGFRPRASVSFCAMCNDRCDHQVLAELCLVVAKQLGGVVDFDGSVPADRSALEGLPGRLRPIFFDRKTPEGGFAHHCDADFLAGWLKHRDFRMVK